MKFNTLLLFGLVCLIGSSLARPADEEINQEVDPEAEAPKKPARPLIGRRPLAGRNNKATSTTTTTAAPQEQEEEEEPVEEAEYEDEVQTSSTTEAPKKGLFKGGVRPFRSNDDLLATLKRRREQAVSNKSHVKVQQSEPENEAPVEAPLTKASKNAGRRNRFNKEKSEAAAPEESAPAPASPARTGRRFNVRN